MAWLRLRRRRRATWIVALAALAVVAAGALAARSRLDRAEPGVANTVEPSAAKRLASEPALAGAPWLTSRSGRIARIGQVAPRPWLLFPPGVTLEASSVSRTRCRAGQLPPDCAWTGRFRLAALVVGRFRRPARAPRRLSERQTTGIAIDLRAPFGYEPSSGVIAAPVLRGVSGAIVPRPGAGTPLPMGQRSRTPFCALPGAGPSSAQPALPSRVGPRSKVARGRPLGPPAHGRRRHARPMLLADLDRDGLRDVLAPATWGRASWS